MPTPRTNARALGLGAIAGAAALWAVAAAVAAHLFDSGVEPIELSQARAYMSVLGFALVRRAWRRSHERSSWLGPLALGAAIALVNVAYYEAIDHLTVAIAIVLQYTAPALVVVWTAAVRRRAPARAVTIAVVAALAGVVLASGAVGGDVGAVDAFGIAMGATAAVMFATYTLVSERVGEIYGVAGALLRGFAWASLFWLVYQVPRGFPHALVAPANVVEVAYVGVCGTFLPFLAFLWGVQRVRAEAAAIAATLEPVLAAVVAWIALGQTLGPLQIAGGVLVLAAVASLQARAPEPAIVPEP